MNKTNYYKSHSTLVLIYSTKTDAVLI